MFIKDYDVEEKEKEILKTVVEAHMNYIKNNALIKNDQTEDHGWPYVSYDTDAGFEAFCIQDNKYIELFNVGEYMFLSTSEFMFFRFSIENGFYFYNTENQGHEIEVDLTKEIEEFYSKLLNELITNTPEKLDYNKN